MELSHTYIDNQYFQYPDFETFVACFEMSKPECLEAEKLSIAGLPPIINQYALAQLLGVHRGFVWSLLRRPAKYYRIFDIKTGKKTRTIYAPRIGLKVLQKWLGTQLETRYERPNHVFGFIKGLSHLDAASVHLNAKWVISVDIQNFFQSTSNKRVQWQLKSIGFSSKTASMLTRLFCIDGGLAQGSPASPALSNYCASKLDVRIAKLAKKFDCRLSRYADDVTFSGISEFPDDLLNQIKYAFDKEGWKIASHKTSVAVSPHRLKVHGLLVDGGTLRMTKGYRNKLRAYKHIKRNARLSKKDLNKINGHLNYASSVQSFNEDRLFDSIVKV